MWSYGKEANCLLFIFNVICHLAIIHAGNVVPVMLWSSETSSSHVNPLHNTSKAEFEQILAERLGKAQPPIIVFVKDNFCVEDIKHYKESLQMLSNIQSLSYLTSVESPISVFENLLAYNVTIEDDLDSVAEGQLVIMQITDINAIPIIYNMVKISSPNLVVALTGKSCSFTLSERIKRAAVDDNQSLQVNHTNQDNRILFYAEKKPLIKVNTEEYFQLANPTNIVLNKNGLNLTMFFTGKSGKIRLEAQFVKSRNDYIKMIGFTYEEGSSKVLLKSNMDIEFPMHVSYHCGSENLFTYKNKSDQITLKLINMQVQFNANKFGEVYDCVGFMSIPIWTGIFVTAILALIMIWGLTMIMDIRTMDRFDDPKGKTITISAQE